MDAINHFVSLPAKSVVSTTSQRNSVVNGRLVKVSRDDFWKPSVGCASNYDLQTLMSAGVPIPSASHRAYSGIDDHRIIERSADSLESALVAQSKIVESAPASSPAPSDSSAQ